jgi:hypothetical protein
MAPAVVTYEPRVPSSTVLYKVIAEHLETFLASLDDDPDAKGLPDYVQREFYDYLQCGILAHGFLRLGCESCKKEVLLAFSCKRRGFCPSYSGRRMAQTAAHLVECVMPATGYDPLLDNEPELARTMAASVKQRIAFGERAGEKVRRIGSGFGYEGEQPALTGPRCASVNSFSLHANTEIAAHRRDQLERLIRYTARGAVSLERLEQDANGDLIYRFTRPWSDGTTGIKLAPYGGCLTPHSKL